MASMRVRPRNNPDDPAFGTADIARLPPAAPQRKTQGDVYILGGVCAPGAFEDVTTNELGGRKAHRTHTFRDSPSNTAILA